METRPCGECTLCCQLIRIDKRNDGGYADFPFDKPAGTTCQHCSPGRGCEIFATPSFPNLCKTYACLWKDKTFSPFSFSFLPESWRPDKVHAICSLNGVILERLVIRVIVDSRVPVTEAFSHWIDVCVAMGVAFAVHAGNGMSVISNSPELSKAIDAELRKTD